ncbi:uncharacterized protein LOC108097887 [Drosophila ficusphila]|uniref:uncharacterized protein LOC108097887 n=1 Tax=Drosophila ficusphila TaxID=30025 RepID=UPI0007E728E1|nr:uncharacterized protein LOC108097887 [Drosophila ficusphila]
MGIIGTLNMAHKVCSAHWQWESQDNPGARTRSRLPKWHRHRQMLAVASPNRETLDSRCPKVPVSVPNSSVNVLDSDCDCDSYSDNEGNDCNHPARGHFDDRTRKSASFSHVESLVSAANQSKDFGHLVSCWWPLNICHGMRQKLHQIVEHKSDMAVLWPSGSRDRVLG